MKPLALTRLRVAGFRNLALTECEFGPRFNVLHGDNGQGKTNLLEAIYALCTTRSFRTSKLGEMIAHGSSEPVSLRGTFTDGGAEERDEDVPGARLERQQVLALRAGLRQVRVDGKKPESQAQYATLSPVVLFHPGELLLSSGPSALRRKLLDRIALFLNPTVLEHLERYSRAQRERQRALQQRGPQATDLGAWEALMVQHGWVVVAAREEAAARLAQKSLEAFVQIAATDLTLVLAYETNVADRATFAADLASKRSVDARRGSASVGPHRDDLTMTLSGHPARQTASQGQHRAIVLALKAGEIGVIAEAKATRPILLLDDVSSELDSARTAALFAFLAGQEGQIFLTTTRPDLIVTGSGERRDFSVARGILSRVS